jgi:hypothetical protein
MRNPFARKHARHFLLILGAAAVVVGAAASTGQAPAPAGEFSETRAMVPMRDGIKLHTVVFAPKTAGPPLLISVK